MLFELNWKKTATQVRTSAEALRAHSKCVITSRQERWSPTESHNNKLFFSSLIDALQRNRRERDIFFIHKNSCSLYTPNATLIVIVVFIWVHIMNLCAGMLFKTSVMNWSFRQSSWNIKCCANNLFYYFYFEGARYHDGKSLSVKS